MRKSLTFLRKASPTPRKGTQPRYEGGRRCVVCVWLLMCASKRVVASVTPTAMITGNPRSTADVHGMASYGAGWCSIRQPLLLVFLNWLRFNLIIFLMSYPNLPTPISEVHFLGRTYLLCPCRPATVRLAGVALLVVVAPRNRTLVTGLWVW